MIQVVQVHNLASFLIFRKSIYLLQTLAMSPFLSPYVSFICHSVSLTVYTYAYFTKGDKSIVFMAKDSTSGMISISGINEKCLCLLVAVNVTGGTHQQLLAKVYMQSHMISNYKVCPCLYWLLPTCRAWLALFVFNLNYQPLCTSRFILCTNFFKQLLNCLAQNFVYFFVLF